MYKIKSLNKISASGLDILEAKGFDIDDETAAPDAIMVRSAKMHDMDFERNLLCIARCGAGTNNIPSDRCAEQGIVVFNTPGANAEAVKELVICAMLMSSRDIIGAIDWAKSIAGNGAEVPAMVEKGKAKFVGPEIMGKRLGVVGLGAIGAKIANAAASLGMEVVGFDPFLSVNGAIGLSNAVSYVTDIEAIYKNCDYISLHLPYIKDKTHYMINADSLAMMKADVRIINLARAELVDDDAIIAAIEEGKVACYVTDFPNEKTANSPKIIPIPHLGASTPESEDRCAAMAAQEITEYLYNGNIINSVNLPCLSFEKSAAKRICILHKADVTDIVSKAGVAALATASRIRGDYGYTVIDADVVFDGILETVGDIDGVIRTRIV